jgi:integrase
VPDNRYLILRRRTWYVRVAVSPSVARTIGKRHIVRSLKTRDVRVARERRWAALAEIKAWIADQEGGTWLGDWLPPKFDPMKLAFEHREWWLSSTSEPHDPTDPRSPDDRTTAEFVIGDYAEEIAQKRGSKVAERYFRIATSASPVLSEIVSPWLEDIKGTVTEQHRGHHRSALRMFLDSAPQVLFAADVDRRLAGWFVTNVLRNSGKAPRTCNRILSSLTACWKWMQRRGLTDENPWRGQGDHNKSKRSSVKRAFTPGELICLLGGDPIEVLGRRYGKAVDDLQRLGLMTGARLNELCELRAEDVRPHERTVRIREGKTESAKRILPVHPSVWPVIEERLQSASQSNGQLFPELEPGGPDRKRSWYVSKRFTVYRRVVLGDSNMVDFHSLRRCFATYLEAAQGSGAVFPSVIDELMGHKKKSLALSLYSAGLPREQLEAAICAMGNVMEPEVLRAVAVRHVM